VKIPVERLQLTEWESTEPLDLSERDLNTLQTEVNQDSAKIRVSHTRDGETTLHSKQYVGLFSLPSGITIEVKPKAAEGNLLNLLKYAKGTQVDVIKNQEEFADGSNLVETVAQLFLDELKSLLSSGLRREYVRNESREEYVRGQINVQKQLQTQGAVVTDFECSFEELTYDSLSNQAILYSTAVLTSLVQNHNLESELIHYRELLRKKITLRQVDSVELENIELNRLKDDYKEILQLCDLVINSSFIESLDSGATSSYSFLLNMNTVFEKVVERAFTEVAEDHGYYVTSQRYTDNLLSGGSPSVSMYPDIVVENEESVLVADAKWKTSTQNGDIYQLVAYELAHETPGLIVYPEQEGDRETQYEVKTGEDLHLVEIPTKSRENFEEWHREVKEKLENALKNLKLEM
jgi:5-methylcytosine-specific restriction enzyme subunit McrC